MYKTKLIPLKKKLVITDNYIEIHTISNNNNVKNENNCNWTIRLVHTEQKKVFFDLNLTQGNDGRTDADWDESLDDWTSRTCSCWEIE